MPTIRQKKVVQAVGKSRSMKEAMIKSDYAVSTATDHPERLAKSKGIQELVAQGESLGLTDEKCIKSVIKAIDDQNLATALNAVKYWFGLKYPDSKDKKETTVVIPILGGQSQTVTVEEQQQ